MEAANDAPRGGVSKVGQGGGRDLKLAVATGLTLGSLVIGLLILGAGPFYALVVAILLIAQAEFYLALRRGGHDPAMALGLVAGGMLLLGAFLRGEGALALVLFLTVVFSFIWYLAMEKRSTLGDIGLTVLGVAYVPLLGSFAGLLLRRPDGRAVVIATIGAAVLYDIIAYAAGSWVGRTLLAPRISPKKTVEGLLGATAGSLLVGPTLILVMHLGPFSYVQALGFAAIVCVSAPLGDLFESLIKRDLGIKDTGTIFPGHGGALDRVDAILFTAPAAYIALRIFGL